MSIKNQSMWRLFLFSQGVAFILYIYRNWWLPKFGHLLVKVDAFPYASDQPGQEGTTPPDAILPLAGGKERVVYAAQLYNEANITWFVTTSQPMNLPGIKERYGELVRLEAIHQGVTESDILIIGETVHTTREEAKAILAVAQEKQWTHLLLVTDPYHTRRARLIFNHVFSGSGILINMQSVPDHEYRPESWWHTASGIRETWSEYSKFLLFFFGHNS